MDNTKFKKTLNTHGLPSTSTVHGIFTKHCVQDDYELGIAVSPCGKVCDYGKFDNMPDKLKAQWAFCAELENG